MNKQKTFVVQKTFVLQNFCRTKLFLFILHNFCRIKILYYKPFVEQKTFAETITKFLASFQNQKLKLVKKTESVRENKNNIDKKKIEPTECTVSP